MTGRSRPDCGYVFESAADDGPMNGAEPGRVVSVAGRRPPYIVVDWDLPSFGVRWPGRLWRVRTVEAATRWEQGHGVPLPGVRYTRAVSVLVEAELDSAQLFGESGSYVVEVLDTARRLDRSQAQALAAALHPGAAAACDRAWRTWLDRRGIAHRMHPDLSDTLRFGGEAGDSPIGIGLIAVHDSLAERARAVDGDLASETDGEVVWLAAPWRDAASALSDAALALGAPGIVPPEDRALLLAGWQALAVPQRD